MRKAIRTEESAMLRDAAAAVAAPTAPAIEMRQFASALGNQAFGRILARRMEATITFVPHVAGGTVSATILQAIKDDVAAAWTAMQDDAGQMQYMQKPNGPIVQGVIDEFDTKLATLVSLINQPNPLTVTRTTAQVQRPAGDPVAARMKEILADLGQARELLNAAFDAAGPAAPPEEVPFTYRYDTHGDKHFTGQDSQWDEGMDEVNEMLLAELAAIEDQIRPTCVRYYQQFPRRAGLPALLYLTRKDAKAIGQLKSRGGPTKTWTIQVDVDLTANTIGFHGYPDNEYVTEGLKTVK